MAEYERKKVDLDALSQAVLEITKGDLTEVKSLCKPPQGVKNVICAVSLLIGDDIKKDGTWESGKKKLGESKMLKWIAKDFDLEKVDQEKVKKAKQLLDGLDSDSVKRLSKATTTFYNWAAGVIEEIEALDKNK